MYLCNLINQTYAILNINLDKVLNIKNVNSIIGTFGRIIDNLLIKKNLRKCKLIGYDHLGKVIKDC